jgi:hypothetical protein
MEEINNIKEEGTEIKNKEGIQKKKRGRKRIKEKVTIKDQKKFFVDYSNEPKKHELVVKLITEVNKKDFGREVTFKDLVDFALNKVTDKDLEKIQEMTLGKMDKVQMLLEKHNLKHGTNLDLGEFLVKQLKIS